MNIVYNSNHYHVVEYPGVGGYELIDKQLGVGGYLHGEVAQVFGDSLAQAIADDPTDDSVVGSSRVDLQACKLEYSIVSPK